MTLEVLYWEQIISPSMPSTSTPFFDVHCHLFSVLDVPLYETLKGAMKMNTLVGFASIIAGPELVEKNKEFIRFFERSTDTNLHWFVRQLRDAIEFPAPPNPVGGSNDKEMKKWLGNPEMIIITPLVMDFDKSVMTTQIGGDEPVTNQYDRLASAIEKASGFLKGSSLSAPSVRVFPFMGFALNKLDQNHDIELMHFKEWWKEFGLTRQQRLSPWESIPNGKAIGIKLYPALGFCPYPEQPGPKRDAYLEFFHWCVEEDIPITTHCQAKSYHPSFQQPDCGHPRHWAKLLASGNGLEKLRINFAHFGGSNDIHATVGNDYAINEDTSTFPIIQMLLSYPNTYADLGAVNFYSITDGNVSRGFLDLIEADDQGKFHATKRIVDKLLWGTDVPMVINSEMFYRLPSEGQGRPSCGYYYLLEKFRQTIMPFHSVASQAGIIGGSAMDLFQKVTKLNPESFLHK